MVGRAGRLGLGLRRAPHLMIKNFTGEDVTEWYPAKDVRPMVHEWTYEK
jgi:hypothetical protein